MKKHEMTDIPPENEITETGETVEQSREEAEGEKALPEKEAPSEDRQIRELNDKYLRLYAEFDNYRKRVNRDKDDMRRYANESLLSELLSVVDNLELALKHGVCDPKTGLLQGVEITLKEFMRVLEKFGVRRIESEGKSFDPAVHHAMAQVERDDMEEKMVAEELRPGYLYHEKVLRPSLVAVSKKKTEE